MSGRIWSVSLFCVLAGRAAGPPAASFGDNGQLQPQLEARANLPKKLDLKVQRVVPLGQGPYRLTLENGQIGGGTRQAGWALEFAARAGIVQTTLKNWRRRSISWVRAGFRRDRGVVLM